MIAIETSFRRSAGDWDSGARAACRSFGLLCALIALAEVAGPGCSPSPEARLERLREKRAYGELLIIGAPRRILPRTDEEPVENFLVYRETQAHMIKSPFVLNAALREQDLAKCELLRDQPHLIDFLDEHIQVDVAATEFLMVSFDGPRSKEAAKIVNAVIDAYLEEVANAESNLRANRMRDLEKAHTDLDEEIKKKMRHLRRLQTDLQGNDAHLSEKQKLAAECSARLRSEAAQAALELIRDRVRLAIISRDSPEAVPHREQIESEFRRQFEQDAVAAVFIARKSVVQLLVAGNKDNDDEESAGTTRSLEQELAAIERALAARHNELRQTLVARLQNASEELRQRKTAELEQTIAERQYLIKQLHEELGRNEPEVRDKSGWALDIDSLLGELEQLRGIDREITDRMIRLKVEEGADARVRLYRKAEYP